MTHVRAADSSEVVNALTSPGMRYPKMSTECLTQSVSLTTAIFSADDYVRTTVFLATVLFLVGISGHFQVRAARYGLVIVGAVILSVAVAILITAPRPPS